MSSTKTFALFAFVLSSLAPLAANADAGDTTCARAGLKWVMHKYTVLEDWARSNPDLARRLADKKAPELPHVFDALADKMIHDGFAEAIASHAAKPTPAEVEAIRQTTDDKVLSTLKTLQPKYLEACRQSYGEVSRGECIKLKDPKARAACVGVVMNDVTSIALGGFDLRFSKFKSAMASYRRSMAAQ